MPNREQWNMLASVGDPYMQEFLTRLASGIPDNHPLRFKIVGSIIAVANSWAESLAKEIKSPLLSALIEKASDYVDAFSTALHGREEHHGGKSDGKKSVQDWMDKFFNDAGERLKNTVDPQAAQAEAQKIQAEFKLRCELLRVIDEARKATDPTDWTDALFKDEGTQPIDWEKLWKRLREVLQVAGEEALRTAKWADGKLTPVANWTGTLRGVQTKGKLW